MVWSYAYELQIPKATGKRQVSLHVTLGPRMRRFDADAWPKSVCDALVHAGMLIDDSSKYVEIGPVMFSRNRTGWGTQIILKDVP
jgi:hypothetical protein